MKSKYIAYIFLALITIFGWNAFLIQRDVKLFEKYGVNAEMVNVGKEYKF
jgi:hypothetical protein